MSAKINTIVITAVIGTAVTVGYFMLKNDAQPKHQLPVFNPIDLDESMVSTDQQGIGYGHKIKPFRFLDQDSNWISSDIIKGKIWVAEYFFTTCKTICPKMNELMKNVQRTYSDDPQVKIMSFTVDPETDTPSQLKRYAEDHQYNPNQWYFLTGDKKDLYQFARQSIFVLKPAEAANLGDAGSDFIHTNNFVLIDQEGRIRGYYDGTKEKEVNQLIADIRLLKDEKQRG